jgi:hydroxymethylglutaryl-CoA reductase
MLIVHLIYDTRDAMGANAANTAAERLAPRLEAITGGRVHLRILSNLADRRLARSRCRIPVSALAFSEFTGERVRDGIIEAWAFAAVDPYRAATHNKGIMNGDAVVTPRNDWRRSGRRPCLHAAAVAILAEPVVGGADGSLEGSDANAVGPSAAARPSDGRL